MRILGLLLAAASLSILTSCGGTNGGAGAGNTVYLTAAVKTGSSLLSSASVSAGPPFGESVTSFTITSTVYPGGGATSLAPSPVRLDKMQITYRPRTDSLLNLSPPLPSQEVPIGGGGSVLPGGTVNLDNHPVILPAVKNYVYSNFFLNAGPLTNPALQYQYDAVITFSGIELSTGTAISCQTTVDVYISGV